MEKNAVLAEIIITAAKKRLLKRAVFSKSEDKNIKRAELKPITISGRDVLQLEMFTADNKAKHKNIPTNGTDTELLSIIGGYYQINVLTALGDCEMRRSKSGNATIINGEKLRSALVNAADGDILPQANNREKNYILSGNEDFLVRLGVSSADGRVYDKKQSKFRQINRFLEYIRDIEKYLPRNEIRICDLCCGKSYLSFAVYYYFVVIRGMKTIMTGVDLKPDVIEYCSKVAGDLGYNGLEFVCADINGYKTDKIPQLVISLHACDTATDVVLNKAAEWGSRVILSTPCCHHELNSKINCPELDFITRHSMLRQKFCDAATDALRLMLLEAKGYKTAALELIDPDETPKNIMLRAIKDDNYNASSPRAKQLMAEYEKARSYLIRSE